METVHLHPLGVVLAVVFVLSMSGLLLWMFRVPRALSLEVAHAVRSVAAVKRILVPTIGLPYAQRGVELACRLGEQQKALIHLTYVIEVPRTLPLNVPLPDEDQKAQEVLERGKEIVQLHGLEARASVTRDREAAAGILKTARDEDVDLIVLGIGLRGERTSLGSTTELLLRRAPCEIIMDRVPSA